MARRDNPSLNPVPLCPRLLDTKEDAEELTGWPLPGEVVKGLLKGVLTRGIDVPDDGDEGVGVLVTGLFAGLVMLAVFLIVGVVFNGGGLCDAAGSFDGGDMETMGEATVLLAWGGVVVLVGFLIVLFLAGGGVVALMGLLGGVFSLEDREQIGGEDTG